MFISLKLDAAKGSLGSLIMTIILCLLETWNLYYSTLEIYIENCGYIEPLFEEKEYTWTVAMLNSLYIKCICMFSYSSSLEWCRWLKSFLIDGKELFILHSKCHPWLLMTWRRKELGQQLPWYWHNVSRISRFCISRAKIDQNGSLTPWWF